jgi:hypothetical protein
MAYFLHVKQLFCVLIDYAKKSLQQHLLFSFHVNYLVKELNVFKTLWFGLYQKEQKEENVRYFKNKENRPKFNRSCCKLKVELCQHVKDQIHKSI